MLANYEIDPAILQPFVPKGTTIDTFEGKVYVSLVAFLFEKTSVLGIPAIGHRTFEEVNLRFYVKPDKDPSIRAVTFIKEIVPSSIIPLVANNLFNENYISQPMDHGRKQNEIWYSWGRDHLNRISATINSEQRLPDTGSLSEFITEHYWGYTKGNNSTIEYEVKHPRWKSCEASEYTIEVDFAKTYGNEFDMLNQSQPSSVLYANGSEVTVSTPKRLKL